MSEMQIPDGISMADLQELADQATQEPEKELNNNEALCGRTIDQFRADIRADLEKLHAKYKHPMFAKLIACDAIAGLIGWHNERALVAIEDNDNEKAGCWFRDAGKLQASIGELIDVCMPDDFIWESHHPKG